VFASASVDRTIRIWDTREQVGRCASGAGLKRGAARRGGHRGGAALLLAATPQLLWRQGAAHPLLPRAPCAEQVDAECGGA
jgi:hypothetical protein